MAKRAAASAAVAAAAAAPAAERVSATDQRSAERINRVILALDGVDVTRGDGKIEHNVTSYEQALEIAKRWGDTNAAAFWLHNAWNEAMGAAGDRWPVRQQSGRPTIQTVHGRRRLDWFSRHANGFAQELRKNALVKRLAPSPWSCTTPHGKAELTLASTGDLQGSYADGGAGGPRLQGRWGSMNDPVLGESCPVGACLFLNVGYALLLNAAVANGEGVGDHVVDAVLRITTSVYGGASRGGGGGAPGAAWGQCARV